MFLQKGLLDETPRTVLTLVLLQRIRGVHHHLVFLDLVRISEHLSALVTRGRLGEEPLARSQGFPVGTRTSPGPTSTTTELSAVPQMPQHRIGMPKDLATFVTGRGLFTVLVLLVRLQHGGQDLNRTDWADYSLPLSPLHFTLMGLYVMLVKHDRVLGFEPTVIAHVEPNIVMSNF